MSPNVTLLTESLCAICEGTLTLDNFMKLAGIRSATVAREILKFLIARGIGTRLHSRLFLFTSTDRLKASILAVSIGADIMKVSQYLSWRDFEKFASEILLNSGFETMKNVRFTKPRAEIDIVATKSHLGLSIDCKHWANNRHSGLLKHAQKQLQRTKRLLSSSSIEFRKVVPVLLTIYPNILTHQPNLVTLVNIYNFRNFVNEIEYNLDHVHHLSRI